MSPSSPPPQDGAEPHLWALQGEASQEIRWPRERGGCFLEGEPRQGRWEEEPKGATEASSKSPFQAGRRGSSEGDVKERIGVSGLQGAPEAGCYGLCGCAPPPPPTFPPSFPPPPVAPPRSSLAWCGYRRFPGGPGTGGGGAEGRTGLWRAWNLRRGPRGRGGGG